MPPHTWVDLALIGVLAVSVIVGWVRGLLFEVLSLAGWVVALVAAQHFAPALAPYIPLGSPGSSLNHGIALVCAFVGTLVAWGLAARLLRLVVRATPLSPIDRLLGGAFGLLRGGLLLLLVAAVMAVSPWAASPAWRQSAGAIWLNATLQGLKPLLPRELSQHLPS